MSRAVFFIAFSMLLTACGGGGSASTTTSSITPITQSQSPATIGSGVFSPAAGTVASGYIECDTAANIAAGNNCNNYGNFTPAAAPATGGTFAFTAVAATSSGSPIADQILNGNALVFPNGSYRVAESAIDGPAIVTIAGGPWATPGSALSGPNGSYGNRFFVQCLRSGTANLQLELVAGSQVHALPLGGSAFAANVTTVNCSSSGALTLN
jgi:hypothetical protein